MINLTLPTDSAERKDYAVAGGFEAYFPAAIAGAARHSFKAGAKHTQGVLVHNRWLSQDHDDCIGRHRLDMRDMIAALERRDDAPLPEEVKALLDECNALVWRACAWSQELHEKYGGAPLAPAARLQPPPVAASAPRPLCKCGKFEVVVSTGRYVSFGDGTTHAIEKCEPDRGLANMVKRAP